MRFVLYIRYFVCTLPFMPPFFLFLFSFHSFGRGVALGLLGGLVRLGGGDGVHCCTFLLSYSSLLTYCWLDAGYVDTL
ncbi:hypothetical protein BZA05DRAFT_259707 [Tricharina praecox]|uniref:uncharacterized protein n=1 Tax=Tricharina praecox TaxID=43433 RepID=UPI0022206136|nr:uncharacterized protein BZA05DRAFT_259707 [Tricharina praecox]KAI5854175.1 hypothetical protein BZA05DRAFT_259707 [Tricharina praecox]